MNVQRKSIVFQAGARSVKMGFLEHKFLDKATVDEFLEEVGRGKLFTVIFVKNNGQVREMTCMRGVTKHLKGGESTIAHLPHLVGVYEMKTASYKCFNKNYVIELRGKGKTWKVGSSASESPV
jgi:hypothetical protein